MRNTDAGVASRRDPDFVGHSRHEVEQGDTCCALIRRDVTIVLLILAAQDYDLQV